MTDDPAQPPGQPEQKPVFLLPGESPPVPGSPVPPVGSPNESPRPQSALDGADAWPARLGVMSAVIGLFATFMVVVPLALVWTLTGGKDDDPAFVIIATTLQAITFLVVGYFVARSVGPVRARDFGLRKARVGPTIGRIAAVIVAYYVLLGVFAEAVNLKPDDAPKELGADDGVIGMVAFGLVAALIAPVAEEIFFRGMVFRPLANKLGVWLAALVSGLFFGILHWDFATTDRLLQVVPLATLGVLLAVLYAWSGTIYAAIAVHGFNNAIAVAVFAGEEESTVGFITAGASFALITLLCLIGPRFTDRPGPPRPPAPPPGPPIPPGPPVVLPQGWLPPTPRPPAPPTTSFMLGR